MGRFILGFLAALVLLAAAGLALVYSGAYNIAATDPHYPVVRWLLDTTLRNSVEQRAEGLQAVAPFTDAQVRSGFQEFEHMCVQCHGAPGVQRADWAEGLRPQPPELSEAARRWQPAELFWIVKHGIKMTGMPAMGPTHDDKTLWNVVAFLQQLPSMAPQSYQAMREAQGGGGHGNGGHSHGGAGGHSQGETGGRTQGGGGNGGGHTDDGGGHTHDGGEGHTHAN